MSIAVQLLIALAMGVVMFTGVYGSAMVMLAALT